MNLTEELVRKLDKCAPSIRENLQFIQRTSIDDMTLTAVWATGCLSKIIGIVDYADEVERLIPIAKSQDASWDNVVAMNKASYTYDNLLSLTHDLLDNIGYIYGVKVIGRAPEQTAKSFHAIINSNSGQLSTPSVDVNLNRLLEKLYAVSKSFTDKDNNNKHKFSPGLVFLLQPEPFIRALPEHLRGNLVLFLEAGAVSADDAMANVRKIRDMVLPDAVEVVAHLLRI